MKLFLTVVLSLLTFTSFAQDQAYPVKPIRLLVGYAPGGATDIVARSIAIKLQETLGQPVRRVVLVAQETQDILVEQAAVV